MRYPAFMHANSAQHPADMPLELQKIISRLGREGGDPDEMSTLGVAAVRIILLEHAVSKLLSLMEQTPYPELHSSVREARSLLDGIRDLDPGEQSYAG